MKWQQGRATIDAMLGAGQVERSPPSREHAERLLAQARAHLALATGGESAADVRRDQAHAEAFIELAERVLDQMSAY